MRCKWLRHCKFIYVLHPAMVHSYYTYIVHILDSELERFYYALCMGSRDTGIENFKFRGESAYTHLGLQCASVLQYFQHFCNCEYPCLIFFPLKSFIFHKFSLFIHFLFLFDASFLIFFSRKILTHFKYQVSENV